MKVLQLGDAAGAAPRLELHPQVTVVTGLDDDRRAWLVDVLGRLAAGGDPGGIGSIEAHGVRFDLDAGALAMLDLAAPVQAVVRAEDLPGHDPELERTGRARDEAAVRRERAAATLAHCRAALTTAVTERDDAARVLDELRRGDGEAREANAAADAERSRLEAEASSAVAQRTRADAALGAAVTERDALIAERAKLQDRIEQAKARRRMAMDAASVAAAALEEARAGAPSAADPEQAVQACRTALAEAEAGASAVDPAGDDSPVTRRMADLERRRAELTRIQVAMGPGESSPVASWLDAVLAASNEAPPVVAALALADTWRDLHQQINALEAGVSPEERMAEERVAMCRQAVTEAEADLNQPVLTSEQIAKVEAVHAEALEAQARTEGRFGGSRARKKLESSRNEERRVLERLGFSSYSNYMTSASSGGSGSANRALVDAARSQLLAAEAELHAIPGAGDRARRRMELLQRRDAVAPRVADLLGHEATGPETEEELRNLREPIAPNKVATDALAEALTGVGIDVGPDPYEQDEIVLLARSYLAEERSADAKRSEIEQALAALDRAVDDLRSARNRGAVELPALAPLPPMAEPVDAGVPEPDEAAARLLREARWAEVETARARLAEAQAEADRQRHATASLGVLERDLAARAAAEAEAAAAVAEAEAAFGAVDDARLDAANDAVDRAEAAVARARAAEGVASQALASVPLSGADALVAGAQERADASEAALTAVAADEQRAAVELAEAEAALAEAMQGAAAAAGHVTDIDRETLVGEVDWELMSRLAAVRSVGLAGSVPLVLDDPFGAFTGKEISRVLDRIAQLAGAVQVVIVSDDDAVVAWARSAGAERAAVLAA